MRTGLSGLAGGGWEAYEVTRGGWRWEPSFSAYFWVFFVKGLRYFDTFVKWVDFSF